MGLSYEIHFTDGLTILLIMLDVTEVPGERAHYVVQESKTEHQACFLQGI